MKNYRMLGTQFCSFPGSACERTVREAVPQRAGGAWKTERYEAETRNKSNWKVLSFVVIPQDLHNAPRSRMIRYNLIRWLIVAASCISSGCWWATQDQVVVYTALDREFSEPIFEDFTRMTGVKVRALYDLESNKTVGLTNRIISERKRPRCDLFWNNEILHTLRLERQGLLELHNSEIADDFPETFRSPQGAWYGFAARARVLIVNTNRLSPEEYPRSIHDLADPKWRGQAGIAKPLFGTTATHAACLFSAWGYYRAGEFFRQVKQNASVHAGNKQVAQTVSSGALAFGLTDTDDAIIELENGRDVTIVYPDQDEHQLGTLFIPNTVSLIRGAPHVDHGKQLLDFLLSPHVELKLMEGRSAQIPLNKQVNVPLRVETPHTVKAMQIDFGAAVEQWDQAAEFLRELFVRAEG